MKIEHIALYVKDLETARNFFVKYLGAKSNEGYHNPNTSFRSYFLSFDDGARLEIMNKPEMPDFPKEFARTGYAHIDHFIAKVESDYRKKRRTTWKMAKKKNAGSYARGAVPRRACRYCGRRN